MARNCKGLAEYGNLVNFGKNIKCSSEPLCFNMWQGIAGKGMAINGLFWLQICYGGLYGVFCSRGVPVLALTPGKGCCMVLQLGKVYRGITSNRRWHAFGGYGTWCVLLGISYGISLSGASKVLTLL